MVSLLIIWKFFLKFYHKNNYVFVIKVKLTITTDTSAFKLKTKWFGGDPASAQVHLTHLCVGMPASDICHLLSFLAVIGLFTVIWLNLLHSSFWVIYYTFLSYIYIFEITNHNYLSVYFCRFWILSFLVCLKVYDFLYLFSLRWICMVYYF